MWLGTLVLLLGVSGVYSCALPRVVQAPEPAYVQMAPVQNAPVRKERRHKPAEGIDKHQKIPEPPPEKPTPPSASSGSEQPAQPTDGKSPEALWLKAQNRKW